MYEILGLLKLGWEGYQAELNEAPGLRLKILRQNDGSRLAIPGVQIRMNNVQHASFSLDKHVLRQH